MKKLNIIWVAALTAIVLFSCSKSFLDEVPESSYSPENTLKDSLGLEAAITGLQASVREQYTTGTGNLQGILGIWQVGTDIAIGGGVQGAEIPYYEYTTLKPEDISALYCWTWAYKVINNANQIIQGLASPDIAISEAGRNAFIAEAKFFRAYAYNFLVTLWGAVPLIETPVSAPKTDFVRAPLDDLNKLITGDLTFAEANLPVIDAVKKQGRISKEAAQQLLAEVYLRISKPDLAEQECQKIIQSGKFSLVTARYGIKKDEPGDPFSDMFIYGNERRNQGNTEAIWVIEQEYNIAGGAATADNDQHRRIWVSYYAKDPGMAVCDSLGGRGVGRIRLSWWAIHQLYTGNDMRNSKYSIRRNFYYNSITSPKYGQKVVPTPADTLFVFAPYITKWNFTVPSNLAIPGTFKDLIMMRLGETYLLLAEAQFKQGRPEDAATSINMIRARAQASPVKASDITMDFILDERARELVGEENRRMTLARTGTLIDRVKRLNFAQSPGIQDYNLLLPIPQTEIDLNKDAELTQNPGYF